MHQQALRRFARIGISPVHRLDQQELLLDLAIALVLSQTMLLFQNLWKQPALRTNLKLLRKHLHHPFDSSIQIIFPQRIQHPRELINPL